MCQLVLDLLLGKSEVAVHTLFHGCWEMSIWFHIVSALKFCCYFIHRMCMIRFLSKASFRSLGCKHILSFFLIVQFGEWWLPVSFSMNTFEFTQSVCSFTSSSIPSFTRDSISSLKADSRWTGTFLGACHAGLCSGLR